MAIFCTSEPGPELITGCGATVNPSTYIKGTQPGVGSGYLGQEKTLGHLKERFYQPGHFCDIHNWCKSCISCTTRKALDKELPLGILLLNTPCRS